MHIDPVCRDAVQDCLVQLLGLLGAILEKIKHGFGFSALLSQVCSDGVDPIKKLWLAPLRYTVIQFPRSWHRK